MSSAPTAASDFSFLGTLDGEDAFRHVSGSVRFVSATPGPSAHQYPPGTGSEFGYNDWYGTKSGTPTAAISASSSDHYSFGVELSGYDGSITHYYVSYSDPYVSGEVGVGPSQPKPTETRVINLGVTCDKTFPGLLSGIGLDLGLRLNLSLIGIDTCVAL
ncbi:hypothetical protein GGI23_001477 [Coemansia sp. RSA 2559]|nr:hypothetical protein GGI23_001477 [Coemansia sp. RSA 2559]